MDPLRDHSQQRTPFAARPDPYAPLRRDADEPTAAYEPFREPEPSPPLREEVREPEPEPEPERTRRPVATVRRLRRGRLVVRKVNPWAVLRFGLVFHFCLMLISLLGTAVIFATLKAFGVIANIEKVLGDLQFDVTIAGGTIFRWFFLIGLAGVLVATAITVFMAFLYNLIADVVGGLEITVTERE